MKARTCTDKDLEHIGEAIGHLKRVREQLRKAGAKQTLRKVSSALKSADGAYRHCDLMRVRARHAS